MFYLVTITIYTVIYYNRLFILEPNVAFKTKRIFYVLRKIMALENNQLRLILQEIEEEGKICKFFSFENFRVSKF